MAKLAVILHGIVGGTGGRNGVGDPIDVSTCAKTIKYNVIDYNKNLGNEVDVFAHSWSTDYKETILNLYNPVLSQFEPQEMFGYNFDENTIQDENATHAFRTVSRYNSLYRANQLKKKYENESGFKYDWVLVIRYDLVIFTPLDLTKFNNRNFYICSEPYWPDINRIHMLHDIAFLTGSNIVDIYSEVIHEFNKPPYVNHLHEAHRIAYYKLHAMYSGNMNNIGYAFHRYKDMEIYRMIMNPDLNELGKQYGELETKPRLEKLLEEINGA